MSKDSGSLRFSALFVVGFLCLCGRHRHILGQEKKPGQTGTPQEEPQDKGRPSNAEGYDGYLTVLDVKYIPPDGGAGQALEIQFDLSDDIPKGCIIRLSIDLDGLPEEETTYTLKDESRKALSLTWKFSKRLALREYQLRTHVDLEKQSSAVQKLIRQDVKRFPPKSAPWSWYAKTFTLGTEEDAIRERDEICETYTSFMNRLLENLSEFAEKMDQAHKGEDLASGGTLDTKKFESYVKEWREKQGAIQKEVLTFQAKESGMVQKSAGAYRRLLVFSQMVSKRSTQLQKEVADKYKATDPNPTVKDFDRKYKPRVEPRLLENTCESIHQILGCPRDEGEAEPETEPEEGSEAPSGEPKEEAKDVPEKEETQPEVPPEKPAPSDNSKKKTAPNKVKK